MNVLFVSQCSKRALTETRRILDQFAERCGERGGRCPPPRSRIHRGREPGPVGPARLTSGSVPVARPSARRGSR